jgi:hypothetical protein
MPASSSDETVEVGAKLYEIDGSSTPAGISSESAPPAVKINGGERSSEQQPPLTAHSPTEKVRTPSIHFLGKDGWAEAKSGMHLRSTDSDKNSIQLQSAVAPESTPLPSMYGRPPFTDAEIEALLCGGANIAPEFQKSKF